jgi:hypothetical protein
MSSIECKDDAEMTYYKEKAMRVKVIALDKMEKHPLQNPSMFSKRDKDKLLREMNTLFTEWSDEQIEKEFNEIVNDRILAGGLDYQNYPIYDLSKPKTETILDCGGNEVSVSITN